MARLCAFDTGAGPKRAGWGEQHRIDHNLGHNDIDSGPDRHSDTK